MMSPATQQTVAPREPAGRGGTTQTPSRAHFVGRRRFRLDAAHAAEHASRSAPRALFFVHVERLREVSRRCGGAAGRALSSIVERRLDETCGSTLARCHAAVDDYALLKEECGGDEADAMAHRICAAIDGETFVWGSATFRLRATVGVLEIDERPVRLDDLVDRAADACAVARSLGNEGVVVIDGHPGERESLEHEQDWREHLNSVLG